MVSDQIRGSENRAALRVYRQMQQNPCEYNIFSLDSTIDKNFQVNHWNCVQRSTENSSFFFSFLSCYLLERSLLYRKSKIC
jgi:hypothetical protein